MPHTISIHHCPKYLTTAINQTFKPIMEYKADKQKLDYFLVTHKHDTNNDCLKFMNILRKEITGDDQDYISGNSNEYIDTYFYRIYYT